MEIKTFAIGEVKTSADTPGSFEAIVSVFGNVDSVGDRMVKGAFSRTLAEKGMPPVVWSHEWQVPPIGAVQSATETDEGLLVKGRLFVAPDEGHAVAQQVYTAMKNGALKEFSFGYSTKASNDVTVDGETVREITDVDLFEVGPTLVGANGATRLVGIKALEAAAEDLAHAEGKAGRVLSKANETKLRDAAGLINEVVATVGEEASLNPRIAKIKSALPFEAKAATTDQMTAALEGLRSIAEAMETALAQVGYGDADEPGDEEDVNAGPFTDAQYDTALEAIQALIEAAEGILENVGYPDPDAADDAAEEPGGPSLAGRKVSETKDGAPLDKETTKPAEGEESDPRIAAVLLARPDVLINQED